MCRCRNHYNLVVQDWQYYVGDHFSSLVKSRKQLYQISRFHKHLLTFIISPKEGPRKCSDIRTAIFNCLIHMMCLLFRLFINITYSNMTSKAKRDQIVNTKTAGISNRDISKLLDVCRKTVFNL